MTLLIGQNFPLCSTECVAPGGGRNKAKTTRKLTKQGEKSADGGNNEKEKKPWKCLEGSNGYFIYKNMAENWCGSSPEWGESTVRMELKT